MESGNVSAGAGTESAGAGDSTQNEQAVGAENATPRSEMDIGASGTRGQKQPSHEKAMKELSQEYMDHLVTVKVDGKEQKMPLKEAIKLSQLEKASQKRLQEAAQIRRELQERQMREQELHQLAKTDFEKFAKTFGIDAKQIAVDYLARQYDLENMNPAERRAMELEQQLKEKEAAEAERAEREKQFKIQRLEQHHRQEFDRTLGEALMGSGLPKNKLFVQRAAAKMLESIERVKAGMEETPLQARDAVAKVKEDWLSDVKDTLSTLDAKAIHDLLGEQVLEKIRQYDISRVSGHHRPLEVESERESRPADPAASGKPKAMNEFERRRYMQELKQRLPS